MIDSKSFASLFVHPLASGPLCYSPLPFGLKEQMPAFKTVSVWVLINKMKFESDEGSSNSSVLTTPPKSLKSKPIRKTGWKSVLKGVSKRKYVKTWEKDFVSNTSKVNREILDPNIKQLIEQEDFNAVTDLLVERLKKPLNLNQFN